MAQSAKSEDHHSPGRRSGHGADTCWERLSTQQKALLKRVEALYGEALFEPPTAIEAARALEVPLAAIHSMLDLAQQMGTLVAAGETLAFHANAVEQARQLAVREIMETGSLTPARFRDLIGATRKYAIPLLECLDRAGVTQRTNGSRVLCPYAADAPSTDQRCGP